MSLVSVEYKYAEPITQRVYQKYIYNGKLYIVYNLNNYINIIVMNVYTLGIYEKYILKKSSISSVLFTSTKIYILIQDFLYIFNSFDDLMDDIPNDYIIISLDNLVKLNDLKNIHHFPINKLYTYIFEINNNIYVCSYSSIHYIYNVNTNTTYVYDSGTIIGLYAYVKNNDIIVVTKEFMFIFDTVKNIMKKVNNNLIFELSDTISEIYRNKKILESYKINGIDNVYVKLNKLVYTAEQYENTYSLNNLNKIVLKSSISDNQRDILISLLLDRTELFKDLRKLFVNDEVFYNSLSRELVNENLNILIIITII